MHRSIGPDTQNFDTRQATSRSPLLSSLFPINFQAGRINFPVARPRRNEYFLVTLHDSRTFSGGLEYLVTPTRQRPKEPGGPPQASKAPLNGQSVRGTGTLDRSFRTFPSSGVSVHGVAYVGCICICIPGAEARPSDKPPWEMSEADNCAPFEKYCNYPPMGHLHKEFDIAGGWRGKRASRKEPLRAYVLPESCNLRANYV
jgi:hypothetical protein